MAKVYQFNINLQRAEFYSGGCSVAYGPACCIYRAPFLGTLAQGLAELARVSASVPGPHAAFIRMRSPGDRKPPGFNNAETVIYRKG